MPERLIREDDELAKLFHWKDTGQTASTIGEGGDGTPMPVWRCSCKEPGCSAVWEVVPETGDFGLYVDKGTRNSLLSHARAHRTRPKMKRLDK